MKFVMFPEGVAFFRDLVPHDAFRLYIGDNTRSAPIAAGSANVSQVDLACRVIRLSGYSQNLAISAESAYADWVTRHQQSGLTALQVAYPLYRVQVFFFPFGPVLKFEARGVGAGNDPVGTNMGELVEYIRRVG